MAAKHGLVGIVHAVARPPRESSQAIHVCERNTTEDNWSKGLSSLLHA